MEHAVSGNWDKSYDGYVASRLVSFKVLPSFFQVSYYIIQSANNSLLLI